LGHWTIPQATLPISEKAREPRAQISKAIPESIRCRSTLFLCAQPRCGPRRLDTFRSGRVAQAQGDRDTAHLLLRRSLALCLCHELGQRRELAEGLETLAAAERTQGELRRAVRLLGAAAALRETCGLPVPPIDRADREQQVAALRRSLGEEAFAAAWAAGQAMSLHEAVAFALEEDIPRESREHRAPGQQLTT
jgi:hypothetical protein